MSIYRIFHCLFGQFGFCVEKKDFERLLNLLSREKAVFWDAVSGERECFFSASVFSAEQVMRISEKHGINVKKVWGKGIPVFFSAYKNRVGLYLGLFIFFVSLFVSQLFVWRVTVTGNLTVTEREITNKLSEMGIGVGSFIPSIHAGNDANTLLLEFDKLSSAALNLEGTHLFVEVLERTPPPEIVDTSGFFNVVSTHDGVVLDVVAAEGTPEVRVGETVQKGQLLINSFMEGTNGTFRPTHARGNVMAMVEQKFRVEIPLIQIQKKYTGTTETKSTVALLGRDVDLFFDLIPPFEFCDVLETEEELTLFGFVLVPGTISRVTFFEYVPRQVVISHTEAERLAMEKLDDLLEESGGEVISLDTDTVFDEKNGVCILTANAALKLNIGVETPFFIETAD